MQDYKGKVAVITGAGRGIGRGLALRCAQEGMNVVLAGIGMESLTKTEADLRALGAKTLVVQTDVSLEEEVENLANKSYEQFGAVDLLINNAGVFAAASVLNSTMDDWNWVMGVNFYGVLYGVRAFVPRMIKQGTPGHVVNVSSRDGFRPGGGSYGVTKHAVVVLTESLYFDLAEEAPQIHFSVYCPGVVKTEFFRIDQSRSQRFKTNETRIPEETRTYIKNLFEASGMSITDSADAVFEGIGNNQLYIGPKAFTDEYEDLTRVVRQRTENFLNEQNP